MHQNSASKSSVEGEGKNFLLQASGHRPPSHLQKKFCFQKKLIKKLTQKLKVNYVINCKNEKICSGCS